MVKFQVEKGCYLYKLEDIMKINNISINKLMRETDTDFSVIKRYMTGDIMRLDIFVLARFCDYFKCDITDIIEYKTK